MSDFLALGMPGLTEWIVIGVIGLLLFGKRLPEVGRSLGKGIVEFKKGLKGVEDDMQKAVDEPDKPQVALPKEHKFDPHTGKPLDAAQDSANARSDASAPGAA